ncbi:MAG: bifunctional glutamate N-acetyltransferase/amino-acid acetyltransferase ArgJ [Proteobacteria bacterium]|nr:bifunctional glutamate N-acetyltransferase/amino-acid acetyltransferase ArgJ [Pseudomonadota bacterium]
MAVNLPPPTAESLQPVAGVELAAVAAGVRQAGRDDLVLIRLSEGSLVDAAFTQNRFCAAPVQVARAHMAAGAAVRALVINTGNANAGTGQTGLEHAQRMAQAAAQALGLAAEQVLPFSTGVILEPLPIERIEAALPAAVPLLQPDAWLPAARGIMTTDTQPKGCSQTLTLQGQRVTVTGIAKGSGMIRPNMATMLGYVATDAALTPELMQGLAKRLADASFNRVTVDGDTSTNDSFVVMATGQSSATVASWDSADGQALWQALLQVAQQLAQALVRDGEGATKFITVQVEGATSGAEALQVAYAVAHSPLVKTAFFASDPNLGRILAAVGYAGVLDLNVGGVDIFLDDVHVATDGGRHPAYREADGVRVMQQHDITIRITLGRGQACETVWTCDLSHNYVSINADYRS